MIQRNMKKVLCGQVEQVRKKGEFEFGLPNRMEYDRWNRHTMKLGYFSKINNCMQHEAMNSEEMQVVSNDDNVGSAKWSVGFMKLFRDKIA